MAPRGPPPGGGGTLHLRTEKVGGRNLGFRVGPSGGFWGGPDSILGFGGGGRADGGSPPLPRENQLVEHRHPNHRKGQLLPRDLTHEQSDHPVAVWTDARSASETLYRRS